MSVDPMDGFSDVERVARERLGSELEWRWAGEGSLAEAARALLASELTADSAVQLALLRNPDLQATYESLGVAQADFAQATLLKNPTLVASPRFGVGSVSGTNLEMDVAQNLLQLLTYSSRKKLAATQYEEARLRVSHQVLATAARTRQAYFEAVAAKHLVALLRTTEEATSASAEYAQRLRDAGNLSALAQAREQALHEEARVAREVAEASLVMPSERLLRLVGGEGTLVLPETLPGLPSNRVASERDLEQLALAGRLDLQALEQESAAFERALSLARFYRWVPFVEVGVSAERETDGGWVVGPVLALEIPLFDQGQAQVARFEALVRERIWAREALRLDIRQEVRVASKSVEAARSLANRYRRTLVPLRERIVSLTMREYNFMLIGAFELLSAKRDEIEAYRKYVDALRDFWTSRARLRSALGGVLPLEEIPKSEPPEATPSTGDVGHMDHDGKSQRETDPPKPAAEYHQHHH